MMEATMTIRSRMLAIALALSGLATAVIAAPDATGYLRYRMQGDPPTLDPIRANDENTALYAMNVFDGLVELVPGRTDVAPAVAESWTVTPDGRTYTFHLRKGVKFHNGREVTAEDVVYSLKRVLDPKSPSSMRPFLDPILGAPDYVEGRSKDVTGLSSPDRSTVIVTLSAPFAPLLSVLASAAGSIMPHEVYSDPNEGYLQHPVGCGPFRFESWDRGVSIRLAAFSDHWKGKPALPGILIRFIETPETAFEEYKAAKLDFSNEVPVAQRAWARENMKDDYRTRPRLGLLGIGFNHASGPFKGNLTLRRALEFAIDKERIAYVLQERKDQPADWITPPGMMGHPADKGLYRYDPAEAKRLLAEAGYPDGKGLPEMTCLGLSNNAIKRWLVAVQNDLAAVGVRIQPKIMDFSAYKEAMAGTADAGVGAPLFVVAWYADYGDPDNYLGNLLHSKSAGDPGNWSRYSNVEVDHLLDQARTEIDPRKRETIYAKVDRLVLEDAALIPIYYQGDDALAGKNVKDLFLSPLGDFAIPLELVRLEK